MTWSSAPSMLRMTAETIRRISLQLCGRPAIGHGHSDEIGGNPAEGHVEGVADVAGCGRRVMDFPLLEGSAAGGRWVGPDPNCVQGGAAVTSFAHGVPDRGQAGRRM